MTMKITERIMHKVRKSAAKYAKTNHTLPKTIDDDDSDSFSTRRPSSEEFQAFDRSSTRRSIRLGESSGPLIPQPNPDRPRRRLVVFDEEILVRRVRPVFDIGGKIDCRELWYQEDEYKEIQWKARKLIKRARNSESEPDPDKFCLRGLEYVANTSQRRRENLDGREAVLDEQFDQFEKDVFPLDDHRIASVYMPYTKLHRAEAYERGRADERDIAAYLNESIPSQPSRTSSLNSYASTTSLSSIPGGSASMVINKPGMMFTHVDKTQ